MTALHGDASLYDWVWKDTSPWTGKRFFDMIISAIILLAAAPIMVLIAVLVRLESPGPFLFRQIRMGKGGQCFSILKFRTMVLDAEERLAELRASKKIADGALLRISNDPRVTRLGRILRRYSLDELPQLINVLRGDMSLVGPRPLHMRDCRTLAAVDPPAFERRLGVLPGLTGLSQVSGRRDLSPALMLSFDSQYAEGCSPMLDLRILCRTVAVVLSGRGAD